MDITISQMMETQKKHQRNLGRDYVGEYERLYQRGESANG